MQKHCALFFIYTITSDAMERSKWKNFQKIHIIIIHFKKFEENIYILLEYITFTKKSDSDILENEVIIYFICNKFYALLRSSDNEIPHKGCKEVASLCLKNILVQLYLR